MIGEADDLMLSLMQIADEEPTTPEVSSAANPLAALKPYPHHKGSCMGMVHFRPGKDEEDNFVSLFLCAKCGKEEIVPMLVEGNEGAVKAPDWVAPPNA